jgi:hypothetical protein
MSYIQIEQNEAEQIPPADLIGKRIIVEGYGEGEVVAFSKVVMKERWEI